MAFAEDTAVMREAAKIRRRYMEFMTANETKLTGLPPPTFSKWKARTGAAGLTAWLVDIIWRKQYIKHSLRVDHKIVHYAIVFSLVVIDTDNTIGRTEIDLC